MENLLFLLAPNTNTPKKRSRKRKEEDIGSPDAEAGNRPTSTLRKKRELVSLEGYHYKETEGYVETWEKVVKKGIKAKRARCVAKVVKEGQEMICGKVFGRVPNCKRHVLIHHKKIKGGKLPMPSEMEVTDDKIFEKEILDEQEEVLERGLSISTTFATETNKGSPSFNWLCLNLDVEPSPSPIPLFNPEHESNTTMPQLEAKEEWSTPTLEWLECA